MVIRTDTSLFRAGAALLLGAALSLAAVPASAQVDLSKIVVLGDSEGAGYADNCLARHGQLDSFGAIIARQAGSTFEQPLISEPGVGGCLVLASLAPSFTTKPSTGQPTNLALATSYNNLAIGGCAYHDLIAATTASNARPGACASTIDLVLRGRGTAVDQALALNPTFVFVEMVGNDLLGSVLSGLTLEGVTVTPLPQFTTDVTAVLQKLKTKIPNGIVFTTADVTNIPIATTLPPVLTSGGRVVLNPATGQPIPLLGPTGCPTGVPACPIPAGSLITLNAAAYLPSGFGIPCAVAPTLPNCNKPLPDSPLSASQPGVILYPDEVALLRTRATQYNAAITTAAAAVGYKVFDTNALLNRLKTTGFEFGGITVTGAFLSGGGFSYDGFHLTSIGQAILADELIKFINVNYNASVPEPDLSAILFNGNSTGGIPAVAFFGPADQARAIDEIFTGAMAQSLMSLMPPERGDIVLGDSEALSRSGRGAAPGPDRRDP